MEALQEAATKQLGMHIVSMGKRGQYEVSTRLATRIKTGKADAVELAKFIAKQPKVSRSFAWVVHALVPMKAKEKQDN